MKIGIFDPYLDDNGGGERYMMTIAQTLSKVHEVEVFWDNNEDFQNIKERFSLDLSDVKLSENIFKFPFIKKQKASKAYDVIIFLSDGSIPVLSSKKLYLHMQQPMFTKLSLKEKLKLKRVESIFCNSRFTKEFIEKNYKVKCDLLYPPVSVVGNDSGKENIIFHVGRFRVMNVSKIDYKKQQVMIDVFKKMVDKGLKDWKFILAISLPDDKDIRFLEMKESAIGYPIEFLINSSNEKLWSVGKASKIYWHATGFGEDLDKNPHFAEHFGISTVEAMGAGIVPVVINAGGQKEIVTDGENGFLWDTLDEFSKKTLKLINDEKLLKKMSENAYDRAKDFGGEKFEKRVLEIIK